jgi:hypothetical protein
MSQIAHFLARILLGEEWAATLRADVVAFRAGYQTLHYMLSPEE